MTSDGETLGTEATFEAVASDVLPSSIDPSLLPSPEAALFSSSLVGSSSLVSSTALSLSAGALSAGTQGADTAPLTLEQVDALLSADDFEKPSFLDMVAGAAMYEEARAADNAAIQFESSTSAADVQQDLNELWERVLSELRPQIDPPLFAAYLQPLSLVQWEVHSSTAEICASSRFLCTQVERSFLPKIESAFCAVLGLDKVAVRFRVDPTLQPRTPQPRNEAASRSEPEVQAPVIAVKRAPVTPPRPQRPASWGSPYHQINPRYTFSNFVVGNSNQFGHAAAMRVAEQPGKSYNPLFIYGGVGLGKTHLLHAIANEVLSRNPSAHVLYMSSETFTNELIHSLRNEKMNDFKNRLRSVEVLLIDDIQFLCGKERTQEEFFHTFNSLYAAKHQIVVTSDKLPQEIPGIEERLQTRFSWGLTADMQAPDFETRVAILKRKASLESITLPTEVAHIIAERISSNVRELEGALTRLHAVSSLHHVAITPEFAMTALKPLLAPKTVNISVDDIKKAVADFFNIRVSDMVSKRRTKNLSFPRHIAMYLCRKHTTCSYPEIGDHFGGRDHSSVIHASNVVTTKIAQDGETKGLVGEIEKRLLGY